MRAPIATALVLLPSLAMAQTLTPTNSYWIPPEQYDKPFTAGPVIVVRGDEKLMGQICPKTPFPIALGCRASISNATPSPVCFIVIAKDDILAAQGWSYEQVKRHEIGHCHGWSADHPGMRNSKGETQPARKVVQQ